MSDEDDEDDGRKSCGEEGSANYEGKHKQRGGSMLSHAQRLVEADPDMMLMSRVTQRRCAEDEDVKRAGGPRGGPSARRASKIANMLY